MFITVNGVRESREDEDGVNDACIQEGIERFTQTEGTCPMDQDITDRFGFCAENPEAHEILKGTLDYLTISDKFLRKFLEFAYMPEIVRQEGRLDTNISTDEHKTGWRNQKANTAAVQSELGFKDHIAALQSTELTEIDRLVRQIPFTKGFAPDRFTHITDFQILKKVGVYDVEKMRIIQLMVSAFYINNKKIGKDGMINVEKFDLIPEEQAGSRKQRWAAYSALLKVLVNDLLRQR